MFESACVREMSIRDAYRIVPNTLPDPRGWFREAFRAEILTDFIGYPFTVRQANYSLSRRNTVRGIHSTALPPGQGKLVTCTWGAVLDVAIDLRVGSPTFGKYELTPQDAESGTAVYLADGIGHAFLTLTDEACMSYLCSEAYVPGTMIEVNPLDPEIGIPWGLAEPPLMSDKDGGAPTLAEARSRGMLPSYEECLAHYETLKKGQAPGH